MKTFYKILKTDNEVLMLQSVFSRIEETFPDIHTLQADLVMMGDLESLTELSNNAKHTLEKYKGICRSSLTYARNHKDTDSVLSDDSIAILSTMQKKISEELSHNKFVLEQLRDRKAFESLTNMNQTILGSQSEEPKEEN